MSALIAPAAIAATASARPRDLFIVALCAEWCGVCREFRPLYESVATEHTNMRFAWLDIEDDEALTGGLEIESFPAVAIFRGAEPVYFGTTLPQAGIVAQLLRTASSASTTLTPIPDEVRDMARSLFYRVP